MLGHAKQARVRRRRRGAAVIEYVMLISLFSLAAVPAIKNLQTDQASALSSTQGKIGGSPVPTDPTATLRSTTTTRPTNHPPTVHLPDGIFVDPNAYTTITPDVLTDPDGDTVTTTWTSVSGATWQNQSRDQNNTSVTLKWTLPGYQTVCIQATDVGSVGIPAPLSATDCTDVKVRSGTVSPAISTATNFQDSTQTNWRTSATITLTNQFGQPVRIPLTVTVKFTRSDGTTENKTCSTTTTANTCTARSSYVGTTTITSMTTTVTLIATNASTPLGCFQGWSPPTPVNTPVPATTTTTTTRSTTTTTRATTTTASTTTTRATTTTTSTTTTRATTTTTSTTTTRATTTTTTTRPTTTTTTTTTTLPPT